MVVGIFAFLDEEEKRLIMDGRSEKVKGIWNCILKKDKDGKILYDDGMMDRKCKGFLEGENAHRCEFESKSFETTKDLFFVEEISKKKFRK